MFIKSRSFCYLDSGQDGEFKVMRVKLTLLATKQATTLPLNYNHAVASLIYDTLGHASAAFAARRRSAPPLRRALLLACLEIAERDALRVDSRRKAPDTARERLADGRRRPPRRPLAESRRA